MVSFEVIKQDIRSETAHGSEGDRLISELIRLRDRKMAGRLTHNETMRVHGDMRQNGYELQQWLQDRSLEDLAYHVAEEVNKHTAQMGDVPANRDPEFDFL